MSFPDFIFEAAFGTNPSAEPGAGDWTDLSDRLGDPDGIRWGYGRQTELDRMEAGVGSVTLDNVDRELEPEFEGSSFHPNVRPMTRVRLRAVHSATTNDVFEAFVEGWAPSWRHPGDAWVTLPLVDGTKLLAQARTSAAYSEEASGTRVGNLLDAADWPAGKRDLDAGESTVQAYAASDRIVLNAIRDTAEAEDGVFFIAPDGDATFRDRYSRVVAESQATFGDDVDELPFRDLQPSFDDDRLWNDIAVKPEGLTVQRAEDQDSIDAYGRRSLPERGSLITSELEADDAANWLLRRYKDPRLRLEALTLDWVDGDDVITQMLTRQVGDRITVRRRPPGGGAAIDVESVIEHVSHDIRGLSWTTTWQLSPAFSETVWLIGVAGFSELSETTALGY